jgi:drug/metabolite transporter (DMT)-like permease
MKPKDYLALFGLAAVWGGSFLFIRVAVPVFGPLPLVTARLAIAAVVLFLGLRVTGHSFKGLREHPFRLLILGGINAALPFSLVSAAELHLSASLASMLNATVPLFGLLLGVVVLREPLSPLRLAGLVVGFSGVATLVAFGSDGPARASVFGVIAMLVSALSYAASGLYTRRFLAHVAPPVLALGQQLGALAWLVIPVWWKLPTRQATAPALWSVLALGVMSTAFAYLLYFQLIARVGAVPTFTVTYLIPLFGALWGALFLHEPVTRGMVIGLALVLSSILLVHGQFTWRPWRSSRQAASCGAASRP